MAPVVERLEEKYGGQVEFRRLDASSDEGSVLFKAYQLPGHPSYILLNPNGEILWRGFGVQPEELLEKHFIKALSDL